MDKDILEYLRGEQVGVIALEMPDGAPHAATVHVATSDDPLTFLFLTSRKYRKAEPLLAKSTVRASVVVGTNEGDMRTFQADGTARLLTDADDALRDAYFAKFPKKKEKYTSEDDIFFAFTPTWWRFTDWTGKGGKTVRVSS